MKEQTACSLEKAVCLEHRRMETDRELKKREEIVQVREHWGQGI